MPNILVVGATRGLGAALVSYYTSQPSTTVYATSRSSSPPSHSDNTDNVHWLTNIDLMSPSCGIRLSSSLNSTLINTVYITAGYFATEDFSKGPDWDAEIKMYTTSSIAPVFIIHSLVSSSILTKGAKIILVSSESGSITLRHEQEGGGNFAHHGSKAAINMVGKQLSFDLKDKDIAVGILHPSFMRTDMTKGVGFDKYWDTGGALKPEEAAEIMAKWVDGTFGMHLTGQYWAPRGKRDIGNWDVVMGEDTGKSGPVQLPW
jgi:NAD(P)-dependent dehydrogenase (short-subunit alcohol dehydrogenase family)